MATYPRSRRSKADYDYYQQLYDPEWADQDDVHTVRSPRRKTRQDPAEVLTELTNEVQGLEAGLQTTYHPGPFEGEWLLQSLTAFYELDLLSDVLAVVKGGKEANVYRCVGGPAAGAELVAAKVYRPRKFRNLRNDRMYREGRAVLSADGKALKDNDHREMRALGKKTSFGQQLAHTSWLMHEFGTLERLHQAGAAVPRPISADKNAILMGYVGDESLAAPTLHEVRLGPEVARRLLDQVVHNLELMLQADLIHGDLSAYNILYWEGEMTIIDFPQVANAKGNSSARFILNRDVRRVCDYFALQGISANAHGIANHLWQRFQARSALEIQADLSRTLAELGLDQDEEP